MIDDVTDFTGKLGRRIKYLREKRNLTQRELAALLDKDYQVLGRIENGRVNSSSFIIYQIAIALGVTMNDLFDFSTDPE